MGRRKSLILGMMLVFSVFLLSSFMVSATVMNITTPANASDQSGSVTITTYINESGLDTGIYNVTFYYQSPGSSTWTTISTTTNTSVNQSIFTASFDTTSVVDDVNYVFNVTAQKQDNSRNATKSRDGYTIDNGNPTATLATDSFHSSFSARGSDSFIIAISADSSIGISNCTYYFTNTRTGNVDNGSTFAASGNACTKTLTPSSTGLTLGDTYDVLVMATDENIDNTNSTSRILITKKVTGAPLPIGGGDEKADSTTEKITQSFSNIGSGISEFVNKFISFITNLFKGGN